jgi:hypothetical protein
MIEWIMTKRPPVKFKWRGKHHSYYGIAFIIFGIVFYYLDYYDPESILNFWKLIIGIGGFMIIDDIIEHKITADTPLRIIFERLILPILRDRHQ